MLVTLEKDKLNIRNIIGMFKTTPVIPLTSKEKNLAKTI
jgi:hypothetical protein